MSKTGLFRSKNSILSGQAGIQKIPMFIEQEIRGICDPKGVELCNKSHCYKYMTPMGSFGFKPTQDEAGALSLAMALYSAH